MRLLLASLFLVLSFSVHAENSDYLSRDTFFGHRHGGEQAESECLKDLERIREKIRQHKKLHLIESSCENGFRSHQPVVRYQHPLLQRIETLKLEFANRAQCERANQNLSQSMDEKEITWVSLNCAGRKNDESRIDYIGSKDFRVRDLTMGKSFLNRQSCRDYTQEVEQVMTDQDVNVLAMPCTASYDIVADVTRYQPTMIHTNYFSSRFRNLGMGEFQNLKACQENLPTLRENFTDAGHEPFYLYCDNIDGYEKDFYSAYVVFSDKRIERIQEDLGTAFYKTRGACMSASHQVARGLEREGHTPLFGYCPSIGNQYKVKWVYKRSFGIE